MAQGTRKPEEKSTDSPGTGHSLRDDAEGQLIRSPERSSGLDRQTPEQLILELQVHQVELEIQAEELRRAQLALEDSRDKYLDLYDFAPVGYLTLSDKALITEVNLTGASLLGVERGRLDTARFSKFVAEKDSDEWHLFFMNVLNQKEKRTCSLMLKRGGGAMFPVQLEAILTSGSDGANTVRIAIIDITERKKAENALLLANKKLNLLSSITRHDVNNQLMSVNGFLELLHKKVPDPTLEDFFIRITKASKRISAMIQFTREYEEIGVKAPAWQDCRTLVGTAEKEALLGQVIVKNDLPAGIEVFADPLIVKVFYNLMDNAVRHGGRITTIRFSVKEDGGDQVLICEDDGDGVVGEEKERIFERGFGKNTGMGLFLSREILDITGITIKENGEPGKGARFEMTVPKGAWRIERKGT
jgi:PAS domain S-box-containing protein